MDTDKNKTIVTVCDRAFIWAAYLLIASLRYHNVNIRIHVLIRDFTDKGKLLLEQFGDVRLIGIVDRGAGVLLKPEAILTAESEYITWIDADCIVTGDVARYLIAPGESLQIRTKGRAELAEVYKSHYGSDDEYGTIPKKVLGIWKRGVGENDVPRMDTTCSTNYFTLHKKHLAFIKKWQKQIAKAIPKSTKKVIDKKSSAYFQTDESVLNSLLIFAHDAPPISEMLLDKDPLAYLVHFVRMPKPWQMWRLEHLKYFDHVMTILDWIKEKGYKAPPIPWSLRRRNKSLCYVVAYAYRFMYRLKNHIQHRIYKSQRGS